MAGSWTHFIYCPMRDEGCGWKTTERSPGALLPPHKAIKMHEKAIRHIRRDHLRKKKAKA